MLQADVVFDITNNLGSTIIAAGALGTAAFGVVEGLKSFGPIGEAGFGSIQAVLGGLSDTLRVAYGANAEQLLRAQYRGEQRELKRLLRQGVRVGLTPGNAAAMATFLGCIDSAALTSAITAATTNGTLSDSQRSVMGRYELAADARIDAALTAATSSYVGATRWLAMGVSLVLALVVASLLKVDWMFALLIGLAAVPLAPIAKDVAAGIQAASKAMKSRV